MSIPLFVRVAASTSFTSTAAGTFAALTGAAVGTMLPSGTGAGTFAALTGAAVGTQTQTSTGAGAFAALTGAAVGTQAQTSTAAGTFAALTGAAVGHMVPTSTAAGTFAALTGAAVGTQTQTSTAAGTFAALTGAAVGSHSQDITATGAGTFAALTGAATGTAPVVIIPPATGGGWRPLRAQPRRGPQFVALELPRAVGAAAVSVPALTVVVGGQVPAAVGMLALEVGLHVYAEAKVGAVRGASTVMAPWLVVVDEIARERFQRLERQAVEYEELVVLGL